MNSAKINPEFIAAGGARQRRAVADWAPIGDGLLAYGAGKNIALCRPLDLSRQDVFTILSAHSDAVKCVRFLTGTIPGRITLLSGSADKSICIWTNDKPTRNGFRCAQTLNDQGASVSCIATQAGSNLFAAACVNSKVQIYELNESSATAAFNQSIQLEIIPTTLAFCKPSNTDLILAVAGTNKKIQIYLRKDGVFELTVTLPGHEDWITSLDFVPEFPDKSDTGFLLASSSQDKYIRLWRLQRGSEPPSHTSTGKVQNGQLDRLLLSTTGHRFCSSEWNYQIAFEALLLGHEDWINDASWSTTTGKPRLLTASADNSLAIWECDLTSGIWICTTRLGEISGDKGASTATGSAGGLWIGRWSPEGNSVISLGKTGGWRLWSYDKASSTWQQSFAVTGHTKEVKAIDWSPDGSYLISTGLDQTTRLFANWKRDGISSWHEMSRPQIHGYDMNCIAAITETMFVSGADEKLLRVFREPKTVGMLLKRLCKIEAASHPLLDSASVPVLGLSNRIAETVEDSNDNETTETDGTEEHANPAATVQKQIATLIHPVTEDHLARHTLWPEMEKLYGHGHEISCVAATHSGTLIATACRASSSDHALIRLYDTSLWRELKPPLKHHSLTVTSLAFSPDDRFLLSVGRDRQWALWQRSDSDEPAYTLRTSNDAAHSRMILDCAWSPHSSSSSSSPHHFATAGRNKFVKVWSLDPDADASAVAETCSIATRAPVTALAFARPAGPRSQPGALLAYGLDSGLIVVSALDAEMRAVASVEVAMELCPSAAITGLRWRPMGGHGMGEEDRMETLQLAAGSDDGTVRIYNVEL